MLGDAQAAGLRESAFDRALAGWLEAEGALDLAAVFGVAELRAAIDAVYDELRSRGPSCAGARRAAAAAPTAAAAATSWRPRR